MSITFYGALQLGQISVDHPSGVDWINTRNSDMQKISDMFSTNSFTEGAIPFINSSGRLTQNTSQLFWDDTAKICKIGKGAAGVDAITQTMPGLELKAGVANTSTNPYGFAIKFMSSDPDLTTVNPKFLAGIVPRATEGYTTDIAGGMAIDFCTSPNQPGAAANPIVRMTLNQNGDLLFTNNNFGVVGMNTTNGADTAAIALTSNSVSGQSRGAFVVAYGNENAQNGGLHLYTGDKAGAAMLFITNSSVRQSIAHGGEITFPALATTASSANAFLDSGAANQLKRSTSSLRYKTNIQDLSVGDYDRVFQLRPISYQSSVAGDDPERRHFGLIAEEVAEVDQRLVHFSLDEEGQPRPESVQYERLTVLLVGIVQDLEERLALVEAEL